MKRRKSQPPKIERIGTMLLLLLVVAAKVKKYKANVPVFLQLHNLGKSV